MPYKKIIFEIDASDTDGVRLIKLCADVEEIIRKLDEHSGYLRAKLKYGEYPTEVWEEIDSIRNEFNSLFNIYIDY